MRRESKRERMVLRASTRLIGGAGLVPIAALLIVDAAARDTADRLIVGSGPHLLIDDRTVARAQNVDRVIHSATTLAHPVIEPDRPWEGERVYIYGTVLYDKSSSQHRMWYQARPIPENAPGRRDGEARRAPALRGGGVDLVLYATSADGVYWEKPELGLYEFDGSRKNNIVFGLHSPTIIRDEREPDPGRRYKMLGAHGGHYYAGYSADGLRWHEYPVNPVLRYSDTITLAQDPSSGEYLAYHKRPATVRGFPRRVVWLSRSRDFQTWSEPELVMAPDERDDHWARGHAQRTEFYNMSVWPVDGVFLGFPTVFRVQTIRPRETVGPGQSPWDGPIDVQLAMSPDGRRWERTEPRDAVIPLGPAGRFDSGAILGVATTPVVTGEETWLYYTAINTGHGGPMPPKRITIGRASWRREGFVSLGTAGAGVIETHALRLTGDRLWVNADASRGSLRVELLDETGRALDGFGVAQSVALTGSEVRQVVQWLGKAGPPGDATVRLRFILEHARLFSFGTSGGPR